MPGQASKQRRQRADGRDGSATGRNNFQHASIRPGRRQYCAWNRVGSLRCLGQHTQGNAMAFAVLVDQFKRIGRQLCIIFLR